MEIYNFSSNLFWRQFFSMAPRSKPVSTVVQREDSSPIITEDDDNTKNKQCDTHLKLPAEIGTDYTFKRKIVWGNAIGFLALHLAGIYGIYLWFYSNPLTTLWMGAVLLISGMGVTIGAHRLFSHRAYKATFSLRLILVLLHTVAGQNCLYIWVRDHRQHHKYSDTDADPHNANRGFFFSHIGWLMSRKHPAVISKGKTIDMSDMEEDSIVMFQKRYYKSLYVIFALAIPIAVPCLVWDESIVKSLFITFFSRYVVLLNITWLVNSAAHIYGTRPFDETLKPVESHIVAFLSIGEGWHNYHHAFPWDYRAAEFGSRYSISTVFINLLAASGFAYDLKVAPYTMVEHRAMRAGDGSHRVFGKEAQKKFGEIPYQQTRYAEYDNAAKSSTSNTELTTQGIIDKYKGDC